MKTMEEDIALVEELVEWVLFHYPVFTPRLISHWDKEKKEFFKEVQGKPEGFVEIMWGVEPRHAKLTYMGVEKREKLNTAVLAGWKDLALMHVYGDNKWNLLNRGAAKIEPEELDLSEEM
jgi:hypothetical protein